ncbi:MAG: hypothetical protein HYS32_03240 [Candidatus Woesearchaeota archaeon]|nr:MAG: hypothetical protein HYS32_03240 [Candidatus Woesearchaeota archaeon]
MEKPNLLLTIALLIFASVSLISAILIAEKIQNTFQLTGAGTSGSLNFTVQAVCGNSICQNPAETCSTCSADCVVGAGNICCSGVNTTGDCCSDSDCSGGKTCVANLCVGGVPVGGGGGGGGGGRGSKGGTTINPEFIVIPDPIQTTIKQGQTQGIPITITNTGKVYLPFTVELYGLEDMLTLSNTQFSLPTTESETITLNIDFPKDKKPDLYTAFLLFKTPSITKKVPIIIAGESFKIFFDVLTVVPQDFKSVEIGDDVWATISIFNFLEIPKDGELYYAIKDLNNNVLAEKSEIVEVKNGTSFSRSLNIGSKPPGEYVFYSKITYVDYTAVSGDLFAYVIKKKIETPAALPINWLWLLVLILILLIFNWMYLHHRRKLKKIEKHYKKELEEVYNRYKASRYKKDLKERESISLKDRLQKQVNLLEKAYQEGFISKESLEKGKERIDEVLEKIK